MAVCNVYLTLSDAFYFTANYCNQNTQIITKKTTDYCSGWTYTIQQSCVKLGLGLYEAPARAIIDVTFIARTTPRLFKVDDGVITEPETEIVSTLVCVSCWRLGLKTIASDLVGFRQSELSFFITPDDSTKTRKTQQ